jgi:hypothetical protein
MGKAKNTKTKGNASSSTNDPDELKVSKKINLGLSVKLKKDKS